LTPERIRAFGLDINNAADRSLLASRISSQTRFKAPYAGLPTSLTGA
jgi:hypothetical protein